MPNGQARVGAGRMQRSGYELQAANITIWRS